MIAIGSGGVTGVGLGGSVQKVNYLPEAHTDMIFAVIGEELGLVGALFVIVLFAAFAWAGFTIALRARDRFSQLAAAGATSLVAGQAVVNLCAVMGIMPLTGIPLPLISHGSSSRVATLFLVGVLLAISRESVGAGAAAAAEPDEEPAAEQAARRPARRTGAAPRVAPQRGSLPRRMATRVLIAAGGTVGHVAPALAVADELVARGAEVHFAGTPQRVEATMVPARGYPFHPFRVSGFERRLEPRAVGSARGRSRRPRRARASWDACGRTSCSAPAGTWRDRCSPRPPRAASRPRCSRPMPTSASPTASPRRSCAFSI